MTGAQGKVTQNKFDYQYFMINGTKTDRVTAVSGYMTLFKLVIQNISESPKKILCI